MQPQFMEIHKPRDLSGPSLIQSTSSLCKEY